MYKNWFKKQHSCEDCGSRSASPPCYDCTFNLRQPPPHYSSVPQLTPPEASFLTPGPQRQRHTSAHDPFRRAYPASAHDLLRYCTSQGTAGAEQGGPEFELSSLAEGVGRIGLSVALFAETEYPQQLEERARSASEPMEVMTEPPCDLPRWSSAPYLPYVQQVEDEQDDELSRLPPTPPAHDLEEEGEEGQQALLAAVTSTTPLAYNLEDGDVLSRLPTPPAYDLEEEGENGQQALLAALASAAAPTTASPHHHHHHHSTAWEGPPVQSEPSLLPSMLLVPE